jgi:hypothetical protein
MMIGRQRDFVGQMANRVLGELQPTEKDASSVLLILGDFSE